MQGSEVRIKCAGNKDDRTCISRNHRDILRISWNIDCKLVFVRFLQNVMSTFCTVCEDSNLGMCISLLLPHLPAVPRNDTNVFIVPHSTGLCLSASAPDQISCLSSQDERTKSEPRRRRHHDSPQPKQQEFVSLPIASSANPAESSVPSGTSFRNKRM